MKLADLSIHLSRRSKIDFSDKGYLCNITFLYLDCLGKNYDSGNCKKVAITITDEPKYCDCKVQEIMNVANIGQLFSFEKFNSLDKHEKKMMVLDLLHSSMLKIANEFSWDVSPLTDAYNCCIERQLVYESYKEKGRYFLSPDRKFYARVYYSMDSDNIKVFVIFYNKKKEELNRIKIHEDDPCLYERGDVGWSKDDILTFRVHHGFKKGIYWDARLNL